MTTAECPICYEIKPMCARLECSHLFCLECSIKFTYHNGCCPLCRAHPEDCILRADEFLARVAKDLIEEKFTPHELHGAFQKVGFKITPERKRRVFQILKKHGKRAKDEIKSLLSVGRLSDGLVYGSDVLEEAMDELRS